MIGTSLNIPPELDSKMSVAPSLIVWPGLINLQPPELSTIAEPILTPFGLAVSTTLIVILTSGPNTSELPMILQFPRPLLTRYSAVLTIRLSGTVEISTVSVAVLPSAPVTVNSKTIGSGCFGKVKVGLAVSAEFSVTVGPLFVSKSKLLHFLIRVHQV